MLNQNLARGAFLAAIALFFGIYALQMPIGDLSNAGPGLFPLGVSSFLLLIALIMIVQSCRTVAVPLSINLTNIGLIMAALGGFVVLAEYVSTLLGIVLLVFIAGLAANSTSWKRNLQVSLGLIIVAYIFERFLGLNLRLLSWKL